MPITLRYRTDDDGLQVWRTLLGLEERLLFVLDGYDEAVRGYPGVPGGREALGDALDLLEGRLLKDARVVLTCTTGWANEVAGFMQRRVLLSGLQWPQVRGGGSGPAHNKYRFIFVVR